MEADDDTVRKEDAAIHRTCCAVTTVVESLRIMGLYQVAPDADGKLRPVKIDPQQRRELLVYISELEELVTTLESLKQDVARCIETASRGLNAVSAYRRSGSTLKKNARTH